MNKTFKKWLINTFSIGALLLIVSFALFYEEIDSTLTATTTAIETEDVVDFYMLDSHNTVFNTMGKVDYTFDYQSLHHRPLNNIAQLSQPIFQTYNNGQAHWYITSAKGTLHRDDDLVELVDNVKMLNQIKGSQFNSTLINVKPDAQYAYTDKAISVVDSYSKLNAIGMKAWLQEERVILQSSVTATYFQRDQ